MELSAGKRGLTSRSTQPPTWVVYHSTLTLGGGLAPVLGGQVDDFRVAVACDDPAQVASALQHELSVEFEARESSYWGPYWTDVPFRHIRVFFNEDPMHLAGSDPPEEAYFEASVPNHRILVDIEHDQEMGQRVAEVLAARFADSRVVAGPSA